jgi:hypothetical protein
MSGRMYERLNDEGKTIVENRPRLKQMTWTTKLTVIETGSALQGKMYALLLT